MEYTPEASFLNAPELSTWATVRYCRTYGVLRGHERIEQREVGMELESAVFRRQEGAPRLIYRDLVAHLCTVL